MAATSGVLLMTTDFLADRLNHSLDFPTRLANQEPVQYPVTKVSERVPQAIGTQSVSGGLGKQAFNTDGTVPTRKLLDRAIAAAVRATPLKVGSSPLTRLRWVWGLASSYHMVHGIPQILEEVAHRFAAEKREDLAQWAMQKAKEERGHDQLALLDIQAMGYEAEAVVETLISPTAVSLINYLTQNMRSSNPIGFVGYSYTMERLAVGVKENHIQSIERLLPQNVYATRFLRMHSSMGSDVKHVEETVVMVAGLNPKERNRIAIACYETALLVLSPPKEDEISEEELQRVLQPLRSHTLASE
jgi:hypothetical protein